jgi:hypothetical protein
MNITLSEAKKAVSSVSSTPVSRAVTAIRAMNPGEITAIAQHLFPGNAHWHQRALFYTYTRTITNRVIREINPKIYPLNFVGAPGYGKSAITYAFGNTMSDWLTETFCEEGDEPIEFKILVRTVGAITDVADLFGLVTVTEDEQGNKRTSLATPSSFPMNENSMGLLFLDDYNRAQGFILGGLMEFVNTGIWNDAKLPTTWGIALASNPAGVKGNKVTSLDGAQMSRSINLPYSRSLEAYFEQLYKQHVDPNLQTYYHKFKDELTCPSVMESLPQPVVNDRTRMMFNHMYPVIKNDRIVLNHFAEAMFGTNMMANLAQILEGDLPVEPWEILGSNDPQHENEIPKPSKSWPEAKKKLEEYIKARKHDLVVMTGFRMAQVCNDRELKFDTQQVENLCNFIEYIPEDIGMDVMRKMLYNENGNAGFWRDKLLRYKSADGTQAGPLAKKFMDQHKKSSLDATNIANAAEALSKPASSKKSSKK